MLLLPEIEKPCKKTVLEVESKFDTKVKGYICDTSKPEQVKKTIGNVATEFGMVDILINNAAIWWEGNLKKHSDEKLKELFEINTLGYIYTTKYITPLMKKQKQGQILNVASVAGIDYEPEWAPYTATKHAVRAFSESIRKEYAGYGIKVMSIFPPGMHTNIFESAGFHYGKADWMTEPENIAKVIVFMLSQPQDIVLNHVEVRKLGFL